MTFAFAPLSRQLILFRSPRLLCLIILCILPCCHSFWVWHRRLDVDTLVMLLGLVFNVAPLLGSFSRPLVKTFEACAIEGLSLSDIWTWAIRHMILWEFIKGLV